jgi:hypothetical protein
MDRANSMVNPLQLAWYSRRTSNGRHTKMDGWLRQAIVARGICDLIEALVPRRRIVGHPGVRFSATPVSARQDPLSICIDIAAASAKKDRRFSGFPEKERAQLAIGRTARVTSQFSTKYGVELSRRSSL